jgi:hypothetical protein
MDLEDLRALEAEFKSHAKRLVEIHNEIRQKACEEVPVQKRFFFYCSLVEIEMSKENLEENNLDAVEITPSFVKDKIDVAILDETPMNTTHYGGYCTEVAGG